MKSFTLLALLFSQLASADFVYMQEDKTGKSVILENDQQIIRTLNDRTSQNWAIYPDITPDGEEVVYVEGPNQNDLHLTYQHLGRKLIQRFHPTQKGMLLHPKFTKNGRYIFSCNNPGSKFPISYRGIRRIFGAYSCE